MAISVATFTALTVVCLTATTTAQCVQCPNIDYDALYDFNDPSNDISDPNVNIAESLTGTGCSTRGVLKLVLADSGTERRRVLIDMFLTNPTDYIFNLGDSRTNNGYGKDDGTQSNDAEVHGNNKRLLGWLSDSGGSAQAFNIPNMYLTRLTLIAGDGEVVWLSDKTDMFNYYNNEQLFALNGQVDLEGQVNYDLFLGLNKAVKAGSDRIGSGLCKVGIKFLPAF